MERPQLQWRAELVVDATGVGAPVVEQLKEAGLNPVPVTITSGQRVKRVAGAWRVPKRVLIGGLVGAVESGRLRVARGLPCAEAFKRELRAFRVAVTSHRHSSFGGVGEHDDLVIAVALAVWWAWARTQGGGFWRG